MAGFSKAVRSRRKLRAAIDGPSGSGKSYSALRLAFSLVQAGMAKRVAVIDTENESASLYAGESPDGFPWDFDTLQLKQFGPDNFSAALNLAVKEGYDAVVVDSLSHAWVGQGGALDIVDQKAGNKFTAWKDVTPMHRKMVDTIIHSPAHVIVTMRSKTEYVLEEGANGKKVPVKIGMAPIQRDGMEYEFDIYASMDWSHQLKVTKTRCSLMDNATTVKPGPAFWQPLFEWLGSAAAAAATVNTPPPPTVPPAAEEPTPTTSTASPTATAIDHYQQFENRLGEAMSMADVKQIGSELNTAVEAKQITDEQQEKLAKLFKFTVDRIKTFTKEGAAPAAADAAVVASSKS